jgi:hypothetical protein
MKTRPRKFILGALIAAVAVFLGPIVYSQLFQRSIEGYYANEEVCGCGHHSFTEVRSDGIYDVLPGHRSRRLLARVTITPDGLDCVGVRRDIKFQLRIVGGITYWSCSGSGVTVPLVRVRNVWRVWIPYWLSEEKVAVHG